MAEKVSFGRLKAGCKSVSMCNRTRKTPSVGNKNNTPEWTCPLTCSKYRVAQEKFLYPKFCLNLFAIRFQLFALFFLFGTLFGNICGESDKITFCPMEPVILIHVTSNSPKLPPNNLFYSKYPI
jgi:hypothetical protein